MNRDKNYIISNESAKRVTNSINELINSTPKKQHILSHPSPTFRSGESIEDMVLSFLAPKIEQWLDKNLPSMVEKIVQEEIKKLIPKNN